MRKLFYIILIIGSFLNARSQAQAPADFTAIHKTFVNIPDSVQTSIYWYWINGNISKEGVIKDLEAMKKVGINRAFIGNIGLDENPGGVKMFSNEWWDILHAALKTATRLNIQIGIFNAPGWSQSGGPWIKPQQSMRYLTSSQVMVKGPYTFNKTLAKPQADFQDVKVLAYQVTDDFGTDISMLKPALTTEPATDSPAKLMDHDLSTSIPLNAGKQLSLNIDTKSPYTIRSIIINTTNQTVYLEGDIQAKINNKYVIVKHFAIDRSNSALNVGFIPFGPAAFSIPVTTSNSFKVVFTKVSSNSGIAEIALSSTPKVENYIEKSLAKMWPTPHPLWDAYQWAPQSATNCKYSVDPAKVLDISAYMNADGVLNWKVPAGKWVIERTGMVPTNVTNTPAPAEGRGLEVDKMSKGHVAAHFDAFLGEILKRIPAEDRKTFKVAVEDSYETGSQNWTDNLIDDFKLTYRYDPIPYLPVLQGRVVGSEDRSDRFLWDLRRLIADNVSFKYVGGLREISHKHGLTTWLENYGHWGFPGEFLQYGGQSDEIGGEFWTEGDLGNIENRAASSAAHIYGKTKVSAESFTAGGAAFVRYPAMFKARGDRFFTEGINNTLLHVYIHQPQDTLLPGATAFFGVEFNRLNTWFYDMDVVLKYLKRCNMMLQQGQYVADAAYFIGEDAPKMTGVTDPPLPQGYSFDYINGDVIKQRLTVSKGKLMLPNGISYSILVLPKLQTIRPEVLTKIKELVKQGAVILGPKPNRSPSLANYPDADIQVKKIADELWGNIDGVNFKAHRYGKGMVISGMDMQQALDLVKVAPDFKMSKGDEALFIHRQVGNADIYFISNQKNSTVKIESAFRVTGKSPELWNAIDGSTRTLPNYSDNGQTTKVPLELAANESVFVVFKEDGGKADSSKSNYPSPKNVITIDKPWTVKFDSKMRGSINPVVFDSLTDWSKNANSSIRYYSGTAWYSNSFKINALSGKSNYVIDLGAAYAIAKVVVNGIEMGGAWTPPYRVDITKAVKRGINKLEIKVVNTWVNRLVGDSKLPPEQRKTSVKFGPDPNGGLQPSGLMGPVVINEITY
ncbi:glycoside hydrolase family 2 [Mucilaginibacter limnophilus]|uniref:Glycoside hydrolase family 2 n=1 Tax=Mucilaginibacter limnophilus TaxID=1932778 RepID=A0A3S2VPP6_9SPHI|nr:glycosyl hydrolase [Mucilaginibacter limnophilus]RVU02445.1 glycoside hydrolase family 2 [Mucilaginibacter limnophilus]